MKTINDRLKSMTGVNTARVLWLDCDNPRLAREISNQVGRLDIHVPRKTDPTYIDLSRDWKNRNGSLLPMHRDGYLSACPLQTYDAVVYMPTFWEDANEHTFESAQRVLKWHGSLFWSKGTEDTEVRHYRKVPGFLICSYPRCGTHMLSSALAAHSAVTMADEVFNVTDPDGSHGLSNPKQILEAYWHAGSRSGFNVHCYIGQSGGYQKLMPDTKYQKLWEHIPDNVPVIQVRRRDLLARHVSHLKAKKTNIWNKEQSGTVDKAVVVDKANLIKDIQFVRKCWKKAEERFPNSLVVYYEDLVLHTASELKRVQDYLKLPTLNIAATTVKLGRPLEQDVKNWGKLMQELQSDPKVDINKIRG